MHRLAPNITVRVDIEDVLQIFADKVPFDTIPDIVLYDFVVKQRKRLERPADKVTEQRGLTDGMWALQRSSSDPDPGRRPTFSTMVETTRNLFVRWVPVAIDSPVKDEDGRLFPLYLMCINLFVRFVCLPR
jgi:hypothetical protein